MGVGREAVSRSAAGYGSSREIVVADSAQHSRRSQAKLAAG
jgi:hypothetical protein